MLQHMFQFLALGIYTTSGKHNYNNDNDNNNNNKWCVIQYTLITVKIQYTAILLESIKQLR